MLRRLRLDALAALLLEGGRPLALVSAQFLYVTLPFLGGGVLRLAQLLESESQTRAFVHYLSEGGGDASWLPGRRT